MRDNFSIAVMTPPGATETVHSPLPPGILCPPATLRPTQAAAGPLGHQGAAARDRERRSTKEQGRVSSTVHVHTFTLIWLQSKSNFYFSGTNVHWLTDIFK
jgi:hypothetical protein